MIEHTHTLSRLISSWFVWLGRLDISADSYSSEQEYAQALSLFYVRSACFVVFAMVALFFVFDQWFFQPWPEKLQTLTMWRIVFAPVVFLTWLWVLSLKEPARLTVPIWAVGGAIWSCICCYFAVHIGPFSEPWLSMYLLTPFTTTLLVTDIRSRIVANLFVMSSGILTIVLASPGHASSTFFPTYLMYVLIGITCAVLAGHFYSHVVRQNFRQSFALREQSTMLEQLVETRTQEATQAVRQLGNAKDQIRQELTHGLLDEFSDLIVIHDTSIQQLIESQSEDKELLVRLEKLRIELHNIKQSAQNTVVESRRTTIHQVPMSVILERWLQPYFDDARLAIQWVIEPNELHLVDDVAFVLFRMLQEGMTNIRKYARASEVTIQLSKQREQLQFSIRDNGAGFDLMQPRYGFGLRGMQERAVQVGGTFEVKTSLGKGTELLLTLSLLDKRVVQG